MKTFKFTKVVFIVLCIVVLSTGVVFADAGSGQSDSAQSQPVSVNSAMLEKQQEVDRYLFEDHAKEIADAGFTVTHTAPMDSYVEIGITPFNEANADFLYKAFGRDGVKVVEGRQAVILGDVAVKDGREIYATGAPVEASGGAGRSLTVLITLAGMVFVLGAAAVVVLKTRKRGSAAR